MRAWGAAWHGASIIYQEAAAREKLEHGAEMVEEYRRLTARLRDAVQAASTQARAQASRRRRP